MNIITTILKKQKFKSSAAILINLILLMITFIWTKYLSGLINYVSEGTNLSNGIPAQMIYSLIIILIFYTVFSGLSSFVSTYTCETINSCIRESYIKKITIVGYGTFTDVSAGGTASVFLNEVNAVCGFISGNLFFIIESAIKFAGTFIWFIYLNPFLALASNLPAFLILIYVVITSKVLKKYTVQGNMEKARMNGFTETVVSLFPIIKLYDAWAVIKKGYDQSINRWEKVAVAAEKKHSLLMSISAVLTCIPLMLTIWIGGLFVIKGRMSLGDLYIFINLSGNVSGILMNMPSFIGQFRVFMGNVQKLNKMEVTND